MRVLLVIFALTSTQLQISCSAGSQLRNQVITDLEVMDPNVEKAFDDLTNLARELGAQESVAILNQHRNKGNKVFNDRIVAGANAGVQLYEAMRSDSWGQRAAAVVTFTGAIVSTTAPVSGALIRMTGGIISSVFRARQPGGEAPVTARQISSEVSRIVERYLRTVEAESALGEAFRNLEHAEVALEGWLKALQDAMASPERGRERRIQAVVNNIIGPAGNQPFAVSAQLINVVHAMTRAADNLNHLASNARRHFDGNRRDPARQSDYWQFMCTRDDYSEMSNPCLGMLYNRGWDERIKLHEDRVEWPTGIFGFLPIGGRTEIHNNPMIPACMRAAIRGRRNWVCSHHNEQQVSYHGDCRTRVNLVESCNRAWQSLNDGVDRQTNIQRFRALIDMFKLTVVAHIATYFLMEPYLSDPLRFFRPGEFHVAALSATADSWGTKAVCKRGDERLFTSQWARPSTTRGWQNCFCSQRPDRLMCLAPMVDSRITDRPDDVDWFDFNTIDFRAALNN